MKNSKIIIVGLIVLVLLIFLIVKLFSSKKVEIYDKPVIALVTVGNGNITVKAGKYAYGDINQDGLIDEKDIKFMKTLLNSKLKFNDSQKILADINHDGEVNNDDLSALEDLLKKKKEIKYDTQSNILEYGISDSNNSNNCKWQSSNIIKDIGSGEHYAFVRIKNSDEVSLGYKFIYEESVDEIE